MRIKKYRVWAAGWKPSQMIKPEDVQAYTQSNFQLFLDKINEGYREFNNPNTVTFRFLEWLEIHDEDGNEIYEGDICEWTNPADGPPFVVTVKRGQIFFANSPAVWALECVFGSDCYTENGLPDKIEGIRVIGNIFQNPNLLKRKQTA